MSNHPIYSISVNIHMLHINEYHNILYITYLQLIYFHRISIISNIEYS